MAHVGMMTKCSHKNLQQSTFESLEVKVKPTQCKHRTFLVSHNGNRLIAPLAPLCSFSVWDLEVFRELQISFREMLTVIAPICYFQLMDPMSSSMVDFGAPKPYIFCNRSPRVCIQSMITSWSKDPNPCLSH